MYSIANLRRSPIQWAVGKIRSAWAIAAFQYQQRRNQTFLPCAEAQQFRVSPLWDEQWYVEKYPFVVRSGFDPFRHFLEHGLLGYDPNSLFSTTWYLQRYPDVAASGMIPALHYFLYGAAERRDPGPNFATDWYLESYPDVAAAGVNPLAHFLAFGQLEGRRACPAKAGEAGGHRVIIVSAQPETPGHHYRVLRFAEAVRMGGGSAVVLTVPEAASSRVADLDTANVVMLWRTVWGPEIERVITRARRAGAVLVFDVDDLMIDPDLAVIAVIDGIRSQGLTELEVREWYANMRRTAQMADVCVGTTNVLADYLRRLGMPVHVIPNGFDDTTERQSRLAARIERHRSPEILRIGYASGSRTHQRDFAVAAPALQAVLAAHPECRLVLFRDTLDMDEFPGFDNLRDQVEWRDMVPLSDLPKELARLDVNIAPLEVGNPFCEAKSALKFFEAALVEVPTVASPTGPFRELMEHEVNGMLADSDQQWITCLEALLENAELRRTMARAARSSIRYSLGPLRRAQLVGAFLDQIAAPGRRAAAAFEAEIHRSQKALASAPELGDAKVMFERDQLRDSAVTVVVPVYNYARYLLEALDSVAAQSIVDLDLVVVDDASTDESLSVAQSWIQQNSDRFNRVLLLAHQANAGLARARNTGAAAVETPWFLPLDADNALYPQCCERLLSAIEDTAAAFAYPRIRHFGESTALLDGTVTSGFLPFAAQRLVAGNYIDAMALIRTSAWEAAGGYRQGFPGWEDYELWCRFLEMGLFGVQVAADLARYRVHGESMLHTQTHEGNRLARLYEAMSATHPWLRLQDFALPLPGAPAAQCTNSLCAKEAFPEPQAGQYQTLNGIERGIAQLKQTAGS